MNEHHVIPIGSPWWFAGWGVLVLQLLVAYAVSTYASDPVRRRFEAVWGIAIVGSYALVQGFLVWKGQYTLSNSLPIHLCSFSRVLAFLALTLRKKWAFYPLFFWGIMGGMHALLTPENTFGDNPWTFAEYFFGHSAVIAVPIYLMAFRGRTLARWTWLKMWGWTNALVVPVFALSWLVDGNYMYLRERPLVDNPFILGEWPWYVVGFELLALLHFVLFTAIAYKKVQR
jgi:hypothetical integral membrane protein (TIGR02206 family)